MSDTAYVLDASALLCLMLAEPGTEKVAAALESSDCWMSAVNLSEVVAKLDEIGMPGVEIEGLAAGLRVRVEAFDQTQAHECGMMRKSTKALGLSLGDRACLQLARTRAATALTADRTWSKARVGVKVEVLR